MRTGISIGATGADQARMEAIIADRGSPQNHVWRCRIALLTVAGLGTNAIMREAGVAKTAVWRWQERFVQEGDVLPLSSSILRVSFPASRTFRARSMP